VNRGETLAGAIATDMKTLQGEMKAAGFEVSP